VQNGEFYEPSASIWTDASTCWGFGLRPNEGAKFWLQVLTELRNRGVDGGPALLIICTWRDYPATP